ncbi:MAG: hypothetical protein HN909_07745 [Phycisphaerales bacterium]|jgi:hypothetical protein|nr:hypothetical protein [Phycisphaerales bacterium]MBT7171647.1 hypothetical protein [Phycisphaerales bacterium]
MTLFCTDRDLLALEPLVFLQGSACQQFAAGDDGALAAGAFTSASASFAASILPGMVLTTSATIPAEGTCCEILSVDSPTALSVSLLRTSSTDGPVAPPDATGLSWRVRTFAAHSTEASAALGEELRAQSEVDFDADDFSPSDQLRRLCAFRALAAIFLGRCQKAAQDDLNWIKAEHYRAEARRLRTQLTLVTDTDADAQRDTSRSLANVQLRRR